MKDYKENYNGKLYLVLRMTQHDTVMKSSE